jgi:hypothetical protein
MTEELEFAIKVENEGGKATWMECFSTRNNLWKRTLNGIMLQFIQQLNGQNFYCICFSLFVMYLSDARFLQIIMAILSFRTQELRKQHYKITIILQRKPPDSRPLPALTLTPSKLSSAAFLFLVQFLHWLVKLSQDFYLHEPIPPLQYLIETTGRRRVSALRRKC